LTIKLSSENENGHLEIINTLGEVVYSNNITASAKINLNNLSNGLYIVTFTENNKKHVKRFIKH
jgi:hypothetical protein